MKEVKSMPYIDGNYNFVYKVKKNAYKKYVEECWGQWIEEDQKKYFEGFISKTKENAYIIVVDDKKIGFVSSGETQFHYQMIRPSKNQLPN